MTEKFDLTPAQRLHFYTVKHCPKKQVLNIGTSLTIFEDIDFDLLREAIRQAVIRNDALRIRFCAARNSQIKQYLTDDMSIDVDFSDFTGGSMEKAENTMVSWTKEPFELYNSKLYRLVMISMPDGYKGLYFKVHHMIMDSYGIVVFMRDVVEIYVHLKYNMEYPKQLKSYLDALDADIAYQSSRKRQNDEKFWNEILSESEPMFTGILGKKLLEKQREEKNNPKLRAAKITSKSIDASHSRFHLETEPAKRLLDFCSEKNVPLVCLILMALRIYLSKVNGNEEDVSVKTTVSRRATVIDKKSGGTRVHFFPCRMKMPNHTLFMDGLQNIQEVQNKIFRHSNYDPVQILAKRAQLYNQESGAGYEDISLTYQPLTMKTHDDRLDNIKYKSQWYTNGVAAQPLYLTIMHDPQDDGLDFYFEYQVGMFSHEQLEYIYYYLCRILFKGIENCDKTIQQIINEV